MKWISLLLCFALVLVLPSSSSDAAAHDDDFDVKEVDSFETTVNETSDYGNWSSSAHALGYGATSYVEQSSNEQTHGLYSVRLNVSGVDPITWAEAVHYFNSSEEKTLFQFDRLEISYKLSESDWVAYCALKQYNGTVLVDAVYGELSGTTWQTLSISPDWVSNATWFSFQVYLWVVFEIGGVPDWCNLYLDNFRIYTGEVDVRVRYWNLYTGLGYYTEKLLARYYTLEEGWVDIWEGEFQAYKGEEVLLSVTDIFGRNVWTGLVDIDSDPVYVDIMVPIVTVHILQPDWYNESVPLEWRITCLPWGPDGTAGMTLPAIGFEFEVLAGWYNFAWLENGIVSAGNQSFLIEGNATEHQGTMMLSDLSIPIDPDYELLIEGDDGRFYDVRSFDDLISLLAALYDDVRVKAALLISGLTGITVAVWRLNKKAAAQVELRRGSE